MIPLQFLFEARNLKWILSLLLESGIINKAIQEFSMSDILDSLKAASFGQSTSLFGNGNAQQSEKAKSEYWLNNG